MYFICCIKVVTGLWCLTPLSQVHPSLLFVKNPKHSLTTFVVASISVYNYMFVCLMVFNTTFANISVISWRSVLLVEETRRKRPTYRKSLTNYKLWKGSSTEWWSRIPPISTKCRDHLCPQFIEHKKTIWLHVVNTGPDLGENMWQG